MSDMECPYCEHRFDYCDDPIGQDETERMECPSCGKEFLVTASYDVSYTCETPEDAAADEDRYFEMRKQIRSEAKAKEAGK